MPARPTDVVVSPHFDDAVLSAAHVLVGGGAAVTVVTVCGGAPADGALSEWDAVCGYPSGAAAAADRAAEDLRANQIVGARSVHLPTTDGPYRTAFPHHRVIADLAAALPADCPVWVPAGLGGHPDHVGTREAVLALIPATSGRVRFYADCPYAFAAGWDAADASRAEGHRWAPHLQRLEAYLGTPALAHPVRLDHHARRRKLAMVACHASQMRTMAPEFPGLLDPDGPLHREMYWTAAPPGQATVSSPAG